MIRTWMKKALVATVALVGVGLAVLPAARAVTMADYTSYPLFIGQTVPPNILFIADFSDAMLPAAFGAYPLSFSTAAGNCTNYCSNHAGAGLTVTDTETFDSSKTYFGMFEPLSCYSKGSNEFNTVNTCLRHIEPTNRRSNVTLPKTFLKFISHKRFDPPVHPQSSYGLSEGQARPSADGTNFGPPFAQ